MHESGPILRLFFWRSKPERQDSPSNVSTEGNIITGGSEYRLKGYRAGHPRFPQNAT
jgi:hypothetical protein